MTSNWSPIEIAKVDNNNITINESNNALVNKLNSDIVNYLVNEENLKNGKNLNFKIFESGDIKSYYYKKLAWRRCTAFLFLQKSIWVCTMCYFLMKLFIMQPYLYIYGKIKRECFNILLS